ncbi:MAG: AI-2E family transporter [Bacillota bacterium]
MKFRLTNRQKSGLLIVLASLLVLYFKDVILLVSRVFSAISPLLLGLLLALIMRPPMCFFENKIFSKLKLSFKLTRILSLVLTYLLFVLIICFALYVLLPQIAISISNFAEKLTDLALGLNEFLRRAMEFFGASEDMIAEMEKVVYSSVKNIGTFIFENLPNVASFAFDIWSRVATFCFAVIFSIYILFDKEKLGRALSTLSKKLFRPTVAEKIILLEREITEGFSNFFSGQMVEAVILGALCFGGMLILGLPYAPLVSTIMMVTAVVPLIGAFIGTIPSAIIILLASPLHAVIFIVFILALQLVEGNLIYPYVVGSKVELPPLVILFAVLAGGNLFGVCGVLIAVPLASVAYKYFIEYLNTRA